MLIIIAAFDLNCLIGYNNTIPWHYSNRYPELQSAVKQDMKFFRMKTLNRPVIMGRTTFQTLPSKLKNRYCIVLSAKYPKEEISEPDYSLTYCRSLNEGITRAKAINPNVFILGGANVYRQTIPIVDRMYLTEFKFKFEAGLGIQVHFPQFEKKDWNKTTLMEDDYYSICQYDRR